MDIKLRQLINNVTHILKFIGEKMPCSYMGLKNMKVEYNFVDNKANIFVPPWKSVDNDYFYNHTLMDGVSELSDQYGINYRIGINERFELHIEVYVI